MVGKVKWTGSAWAVMVRGIMMVFQKYSDAYFWKKYEAEIDEDFIDGYVLNT